MPKDHINPRIIQSSPGRTGSTLLTNILYGLYCDIPVFYSDDINSIILKNNFVVKTHNLDFDQILNANNEYHLFFVCSERPEINQIIDIKYKKYNNVLIFSYEQELKETENLTVSDIVVGIYNKLLNFIPEHINKYANINRAITRIINMNKFYENIKDLPFSYHDNFYKIHGSHRNREYV